MARRRAYSLLRCANQNGHPSPSFSVLPPQRSNAWFSSSPLPSTLSSSSFANNDDEISGSKIISSTYYKKHYPAKNGTHHIHSHQRGYGKIVALASSQASTNTISTYLTDIQHSSPMRLVPSRRTHPTQHNIQQQQRQQQRQNEKYEAALIHLSSYGGGLVPGDTLHLDIDVCGHGAIVCILTQGGQRIYRPGKHFRKHDSYTYKGETLLSSNVVSSSKLCQSTIQCTVEPGSTLMYLPDPTVPYYQSSFQESREFISQYDTKNKSNMGSIIAVDWYSSGRRFSTGMEDERWAFDHLATRTELFIVEKSENSIPRPALIESLILDNTLSKSRDSSSSTPSAIALGKNMDSMATLLLHGPTSLSVAKRAISLSHQLAGECTRTRSRYAFGDELNYLSSDDTDANEEKHEEIQLKKLLEALGGKVLLSVTPIKQNSNDTFNEEAAPTHMVRILAECNEDIYRILHYCLKPCSLYLGGFEPYRDRIYSSKTVNGKATSSQRNLTTNGRMQISNQQKQEEDEKQLIQQHTRKVKPDLHSITNALVFGKSKTDLSFNNENWFRLCSLSDSALPVGSFAHSLGIEAASQMNIFIDDEEESNGRRHEDQQWSSSDGSSSCSVEALSDYIHSVSRSNAQFSTPLILAGYSLLVDQQQGICDAENIHQLWLDIDAYVDTILLSNEPGRRASTDQGLGLLRIAPAFIESQHSAPTKSSKKVSELWDLIRESIDVGSSSMADDNFESQSKRSLNTSQSFANGHSAPIYGILCASLKIPPLDACRVFAFGAARDTVSAAVRLNLVGPMEGLSILDGVGRGAVEEGLEGGLVGMLGSDGCHTTNTREEQLKHWLHSVATSAPVMDTVQPLHDLLSVRLFRT